MSVLARPAATSRRFAPSFDDALRGSNKGPSAFALVYGLPVPQSRWQIAPWDAGAFAEQDPGDDGAVIASAATAGRALRQQRLEQDPLGVGELESCASSVSINIETHQIFPQDLRHMA
jgi:hypothetical protein